MKSNLLKRLFPLAFFIFISSIIYAEAPESGDALVSVSIADARTLVPILASDGASASVVALIFNGLIKYDKDLNLIGDLAKSWEIKDQGLTIIFHLRKGVRWHDEKEFTAEDVKFTYERLIDPNVPTPYSSDFKMVKSLQIVDRYTIKITYAEPFAPGLASWSMSIMPKHILEGEDLLKTKFKRNPIGTGPFKFKQWKTAQRIDLVSNEKYFLHEPYINRYIYRVIPNQSTQFLELQSQGIDEMSLTPIQYEKLTETSFFKKRFNKYRYPAFAYTYLGYNLKDERFKNKKIRQALNYAIDKKEIIQGVLLGLGRECTGPFPQESWAYNSQVKPKEFNPKRAKEILKQLGWQDSDNDGWLDNEGERFEFTILTNQGNEKRKLTAEIIQRRLKDIGIKVKIKILEWSVFLKEFIDKGRFEAIILGWSLSREPDLYDIWHSSKTKEGEFNFIGYGNPKVDELILQGRKTFDIEKRKEIYRKLHKILYDEQPYMFLYVPDALIAVQKRFKNVEPAPIGIGYNLIDWYVPKNQQKYIQW